MKFKVPVVYGAPRPHPVPPSVYRAIDEAIQKMYLKPRPTVMTQAMWDWLQEMTLKPADDRKYSRILPTKQQWERIQERLNA